MSTTVIEQTYVTPAEPGSYSGIEKLHHSIAKHKNIHVPRHEIQKWLKGNDTYTIHKVARKNFKRNPIIAGHIDEQWQGDLAEMGNLATWNDGVRYLLCLIDVVSKYAWVEPLKSKHGPSVLNGFKRVWERTDRRPEKLQTDDGTEFKYRGVQDMLRQMNITFFTVKSDKKAAIAERFIRTLKDKIHRYLDEKHKKKYMDVLQDLVISYNKTYHKSIKMAPVEVGEHNEGEVLETLYGHLWDTVGQAQTKYNVGELVRISELKHPFKKGYLGHWTEEIFRINAIKRHAEPRLMYKLEDWSGKVLEGSFYDEELQAIDKDLQGYWKVEKVLITETQKNGKKKHFVKWQGYPNSMNSWVKDEDMILLT
jgi:hypothetical protein